MDTDTKQVLSTVCDMLCEQINHYVELEKNFVCLMKALMDRDAVLHSRFEHHKQTMNLASTRDVTLENHDALVQLGRIIQRLNE
jgi:hypothetical protein